MRVTQRSLPALLHLPTKMDNKKYTIDFDQLYDSTRKCKKGVSWKPSVKSFILNDMENLHRMERQLKNGTWKNGKPRPIKITYPKKRDGLSISFKDRVYQRCINDNVLYPSTTRTFIYDNYACQTGKGPDKAREQVKRMMWRFYCKYGTDGYVLQTDIKGYYPNMSHTAVKEMFKKYLSPEAYRMTCEVLDDQYNGEIGYNPGSQMVQIAGITLLNTVDHYIKERLHARYYTRYMDDGWQLERTREKLEHDLPLIAQEMEKLGCCLNMDKTRIVPLSKGFTYLGFRYRIADSGKITMTVSADNVKHERRKLRKMVQKSRQGKIPKEKVEECYLSWKNHASKGNDKKTIFKMDTYYKRLWRNGNAKPNKKSHADQAGKRV